MGVANFGTNPVQGPIWDKGGAVVHAHARPFNTPTNGVADALAGLTAAMAYAAALGGGRVIATATQYAFSGLLTIPAGVTLVLPIGTTLKPMAGFTANNLIAVQSRSAMTGDWTVDCANLPHQAADWLGVATPKGCALVADGTAGRIDRVRLQGGKFINCPNGAIFGRITSRWRIVGCEFVTNQTDTAHVRSAVVEFYDDQNSRVIDSPINGYTQKGFNFGNSVGTKAIRSDASGGAQDVGHAAHYMDGCTDCSYVDCKHSGPGFGFKANDSLRPRLIRYDANGSAAMCYFQGCIDFYAEGCNFTADAASKQAYIIHGITVGGVPKHAKGGLIVGGFNRRSVMGTTSNHVGLNIIGDATADVLDVTVRDVVFEKFFYTVNADKVTDALYGGLVFDNVKSITPGSYSFVLFSHSFTLRNCFADMGADGNPPVALFSNAGVPATLWDVDGLRVKGMTSTQAAIEIGRDASNAHQCRVDTVNVRRVRSDGGTYNLRVDITNTAGGAGTNYIKELNVEHNHGRGLLSATGMTLDFSPTQKTRLSFIGNKLHDLTGGVKNVVMTDPGGQVTGVCYGNDVGAITGKPVGLGVGL